MATPRSSDGIERDEGFDRGIVLRRGHGHKPYR
jgi:hypothetical protein